MKRRGAFAHMLVSSLMLLSMMTPLVSASQRPTRIETRLVNIIGGVESDLTRIQQAAVLSNGKVALLQLRDRHIKLLDPSTGSWTVVGRQGEGPGEFQVPTNVGAVGAGFWVFDSSLSRISQFTESGDLIDSTPAVLPQELRAAGYRLLAVDQVFADRRMVVRIEPVGVRYREPGDDVIIAALVAEDMQIIERLYDYSLRDWRLIVQEADVEYVMEHHFSDIPVTLPRTSEEMVVVADRFSSRRGVVHLIKHSSDGNQVDTLSINLPSRLVSRSFADGIVARNTEAVLRSFDGNRDRAERVIRRELGIPEYQPGFSNVAGSSDSRVAFQIESLAESGIDGVDTQWWIVDTDDGRVLGRFSLPRLRQLIGLSGNIAVASYVDDLGLTNLEFYELSDTEL